MAIPFTDRVCYLFYSDSFAGGRHELAGGGSASGKTLIAMYGPGLFHRNALLYAEHHDPERERNRRSYHHRRAYPFHYESGVRRQ